MLAGVFRATKGITGMFQNGHSNGYDAHDIEQGDYVLLAQSGVPQQDSPYDDLAILTQQDNSLFAGGLHIVLTCSAYDDEDYEV